MNEVNQGENAEETKRTKDTVSPGSTHFEKEWQVNRSPKEVYGRMAREKRTR